MSSRRIHHRARWALVIAFPMVIAGDWGNGLCDERIARDQLAIERLRSPPLGLPSVPIPRDNPATIEKIALGRKLFFDRRLSRNGTMSCGMCHIPEQGFTNNELATPVGINGKSVRRNAPTILNAAYLEKLFLDGRVASLEAQAILPLFAHDEMGNESQQEFIDKVSSLADYQGMFEAAFGAGPSLPRVGKAIASWERTLIAADAPFDRWRDGRQQALNADERHGYDLFAGKARCVQCHSFSVANTLFSDQAFHDTGIGYLRRQAIDRKAFVRIEIAPGQFVSTARKIVAQVEEARREDVGRHEVTGQPQHKWQYRTPSLRNVAVTAPYMHDGSLPTLDAVVRYYNKGGTPHAGLDPLIEPLDLNDDEVDSLVSFLRSLTASNLSVLCEDARHK